VFARPCFFRGAAKSRVSTFEWRDGRSAAFRFAPSKVLNSLRMRTDILPLCDQHFRTMEPALAPYNADYSIEYFRCTDKFCHRCFGERVGYSTPKRGEAPVLTPNQPICDRHGRPMFIISHDRQRNHVTYACPEPDCSERVMRT